jgi:Flp pilus assembly protein TadG
MRGRLRDESGQALLMTVVFTTVLVGATALAVDVGSWFREHRQAQSTADAAALAGAQALPHNPGQAAAWAQEYADKNGAGVIPGGITFRSDVEENDTVVVEIEREAEGFFSRVFGIDSTTVDAKAAARAGIPIEVRGAAPIVVSEQHPLLAGPGCPCFKTTTTLPLDKLGAPGAFGLINLDLGSQGTMGSSTLGEWIANGYDDYLPRGLYSSDPGAKFNSDEVSAALTARLTRELLFPVYSTLERQGQNAQYNVIGWVAFRLASFDISGGNEATLTGQFTQVIWDGIQSAKNQSNTAPDFGVRSIAIVN